VISSFQANPGRFLLGLVGSLKVLLIAHTSTVKCLAISHKICDLSIDFADGMGTCYWVGAWHHDFPLWKRQRVKNYTRWNPYIGERCASDCEKNERVPQFIESTGERVRVRARPRSFGQRSSKATDRSPQMGGTGWHDDFHDRINRKPHICVPANFNGASILFINQSTRIETPLNK
jgi:hypothetical protein